MKIKNFKNFKKINRGITLIALVVTIVVLIILAGVSITSLTGNKGTITQARQAKSDTEKADIIERAQADILKAQIESPDGDISISELKDILDKYFEGIPETTEELEENLKDPEYKLKAKEEYGKDIKIKVSDIYDGEISIGTVEDDDPRADAKEILKINPNADSDYEKSPYVKYNDIICRVFYNDEKHGLQIISADNMQETVTLGSNDDYNKSKDDYNNAVDILNNKAKEYMSVTDKQEATTNKIVIDARSLGSNATLKGGKFQGDPTIDANFSFEHGYGTEYNDQFKISDENHTEDADSTTGQLKKLGLNATTQTWLASRYVLESGSFCTYFCVRTVDCDGSTDMNSEDYLCIVHSHKYNYKHGFSHGFRPVFLLSSKVKIIGGNGTSNSPYELGI